MCPATKSLVGALRHPVFKGRRVLKLAEVPLMMRRSPYLSTVILLIFTAIYSIHVSLYRYIVQFKMVLISLKS